jgi:hypothetical protein
MSHSTLWPHFPGKISVHLVSDLSHSVEMIDDRQKDQRMDDHGCRIRRSRCRWSRRGAGARGQDLRSHRFRCKYFCKIRKLKLFRRFSLEKFVEDDLQFMFVADNGESEKGAAGIGP